MKSISISRSDSGAVSIFVVIFAALLITIVTVSFVRIMINDQQQATANDLSQSAYDSAQAGVEDAKRALLRYLSVCREDGPVACATLAGQLSGPNVGCNEALINVAGVGSVSGEVRVQQTTSATEEALDQAYTCVKINLNTPDYVGNLAQNESALVPLRGSSTFDTVSIEWFSREDLDDAAASTVDLSNAISAPKPLLQQSSWPVNRPPVLRAQLMQVGSSFTLEQFDYATGGTSNANTVFMYPTSTAAASTNDIAARDPRKTTLGGDTPQDQPSDTPLPVHCQASLTAGGYSCKMSLTIPSPVGGGERNAFLRVTPFYTATHFRITLQNGASPVDFSGIQPEIDSTGRANDLFRRVVSRVDLVDTSFPYPDAALDLTGNLCKDFAVTDTTYIPGATCTP